jgi:hypothetical protein
MPHHSQLLADVPQGTEPCACDCRDQEEHGLHLKREHMRRRQFFLSLHVHLRAPLHLMFIEAIRLVFFFRMCKRNSIKHASSRFIAVLPLQRGIRDEKRMSE